MRRGFFDTNVVVYAAIRSPDPRHVTAQRLLTDHIADSSMVCSTQVLQETYSVLTTKKGVQRDAALAVVKALAKEEVVPSKSAFVLRSIELSQRYQLSVWDGLMVQAALDADCDVLYTEDLPAGMRFGKLEVVNPFRVSAHQAQPTYRAGEDAAPPAATASPARALRRPRK